jgi:hypothetical protein
MNDFAAALDNVKKIGSSDPKDDFMQKISKTAKGSFVGLIGGLMAGWYYKKSLYVYGIIGTIIGGGINLILNNNENES